MKTATAPKLSLVTVNRNDAVGLARTLDSVRAQTFRDFEHVVIDGASTDGSVDEIRARADGLAYWTSEPDGGIYAAMNKGWRRARGEYVNFLNSGDWLAAPDVLERVFAREPVSADMVYGDSLRPDGAGGWKLLSQPDEWTAARFFDMGICHQTLFYRRELLEMLGGYDERYRIVADWEFNFRALLAGRSARHLPLAIVGYAGGGVSATRVAEMEAEKRDMRARLLPAAVLRDYEQWLPVEKEWRRLKNVEAWVERLKARNPLLNFAMAVQWSLARPARRPAPAERSKP